MRRTQIQLAEQMYETLRRRAFQQGTSLAETIRQLLVASLSGHSGPAKSEIRDFTFIGAGRSCQGHLEPVSERHDEALAKFRL